MDKEELKELFDRFLEENYESNNWFNSESHRYFKGNYPESILVQVEKGGSSGGNCWNDNPSEPYEREVEEVESDIISSIKSRLYLLVDELGLDLKSKESRVTLFSATHQAMENEVHEKFINEYYGNYTLESIFAVDLRELLKNILDEDQFEVLEKSLNNFISEKKPELLEELEEKKENKRKMR